jgi:hypothetical protein
LRQSRFAGDVRGLSFEATVVRLAGLAVACGGTLAAVDVEEDGPLMENRGAARPRRRPNARRRKRRFAEPATDSAQWFPHARLTFTLISDEADRCE